MENSTCKAAFSYPVISPPIIERGKKNPNNIAVICEDKSITYGELDKKANSLANHLIKRGIKIQKINQQYRQYFWLKACYQYKRAAKQLL